MKRFLTGLIATAFLAASAPAEATAPLVRAPHEMVAAANPLAAQAGLDVLHKGGSAVDAAVAVEMMLTLTEPESSGLGGGGFMMVWDPKTKTLTSFDGRETAPASATPTMFLGADGQPLSYVQAIPGGRSTGVPGELAMLAMAQKKFGRLAWSSLFDTAIRLAGQGVPVTPKLAYELRAYPWVPQMPAMRAMFFKPDGTPLAEGDIRKDAALAQTFRAIAAGGPDAFYRGPIAQEIADAVTNAPVNAVPMTAGDIAAYRAFERKPLCGHYRGFRICAPPPPSSGGVTLLEILGMLDHYRPAQLKPLTVGGIHLVSQASKLAYADRDHYLADPAFVEAPIAGLLDATYLTQRARLIDLHRDMGKAAAGVPPTRHAAIQYAPDRFPGLPGTSHFCVVDKNGEVVSNTASIEFALGSDITAGGFLLNNELTDFSFEPLRDGKPVANAPAPGKRPLSSMTPVIAFGPDGKFAFAVGSAGGRRIIADVTQVIVALIDGHENIAQALSDPRHAETGGPLSLEEGTPLVALTPAIAAMGYSVRTQTMQSGLHGIVRVKGGYEGAADPRRDGAAVGD